MVCYMHPTCTLSDHIKLKDQGAIVTMDYCVHFLQILS